MYKLLVKALSFVLLIMLFPIILGVSVGYVLVSGVAYAGKQVQPLVYDVRKQIAEWLRAVFRLSDERN